MKKGYTLQVAREFTPYVAGRYRSDGPGSGEELRELIQTALRSNESVLVDFDGVAMVPASFLEEVFGGLARQSNADNESGSIRSRIDVVCSERPAICSQALGFFDDAARG